MKNLCKIFVASLVFGLIATPSTAQSLDPGLSSGDTLIEPGVDLRDYVSAGKTPPVAVDSFGYIWTMGDNGYSTPLLMRINAQGVIDTRFQGLAGSLDEMQKFGTTRNGDLLFCGVNQATHQAVVSRYRTLAYGAVSMIYQARVVIPPPYTWSGDPFFPSNNPRIATLVSCVEDASGAVVLRFITPGSIGSKTFYARILSNGVPDAAFGSDGVIAAGTTFNSSGVVNFGAATLDWLDADGTINLVTEGAIMRDAQGVFSHPAALWRMRPPTAMMSAWAGEAKDISFRVDPSDFSQRLHLARYVDGDNIVFIAQPFLVANQQIGNVYRVDKRTGVRSVAVQSVYLPLFHLQSTPTFQAFSVDGKPLLFGVNSTDGGAAQRPFPYSESYKSTLWVKRMDAVGGLQSVAAGLAITVAMAPNDVRSLPDGSFILASAGLITKDGKNAVPGLVRFAADYQNPRTSEFIDAKRGTYFFTADTNEIEQIWQWTRNGVLPDWKPARYASGAQSFKAGPLDNAPSIATAAACRFFAPSLLTHFYASSAQECAALKTGESAKFFAAEAPNFALSYPSPSGTCGSGTSPVWRFFSGKPPLNHRWVTTTIEINKMLALGWIDEGVQLCAAQ